MKQYRVARAYFTLPRSLSLNAICVPAADYTRARYTPAAGRNLALQSNREYAFVCVDIKPGHHPVKRRGVTSVTKCHKCNGTGIIFIGEYSSLVRPHRRLVLT